MQPAEFEEKEYEGPLNNQLLQGHPHLWSPGQVFEEHFGFDAAMWVANPHFWSAVGFPEPLRGAALEDFRWGFVWLGTRRRRPLPSFRTNLLLQVKRPEYLTGPNFHLARYGIRGAYFRFALTEHQQRALERVAQRLGNRALVSYACPAFHTHRELFDAIAHASLVSRSTFVRAQRLAGHRKWAYDSPGTSGVGLSDPEPMEDAPFDAQVAALVTLGESVAVGGGVRT